MVWLAATASIFLYLIPVAVVLAVRSFRQRSAWEIALDIPFAVSVDLISVLMLGFLMRLETATLASRVLWLVGGSLWLWKQKKGGRGLTKPAIRGGQILGVLASVFLAVLISMTLSRTYQIWDRYWHLPLVPSLRGQKLPFANVYEPGGRLQYHYAADAMAAMLQSLSFCNISSDMALAEAHDLAFGGIGATISLLAAGLGWTRVLPLALAGPAVLLQGPALLRGDAGNLAVPFHGYSYSHYLTNSMRPHVALGGLLLTGFIGAIAVRLFRGRAEPVPTGLTFPTLCATAATLAITDEASLLFVAIAAGAVWLIDANTIATRRAVGIACWAALGAAVVFTRWRFVGIRGGPVETITWVAARIPGMQGGSRTDLYSREGLIVLLCDFFPFLVATLGLALAALSQRGRSYASVVAFSGMPVVLCFVGLTHIEINHTPSESVRFFIAPCFVSLMLGVLWLPRLARASLARAVVLTSLIVPALFTVYWLCERRVPELGAWTVRGPFESTQKGAYGSSCRAIAGAKLGDTPQVTYVDTAAWYRYASCRPIYAPGMVKPPWKVKIGSKGQWYPKTQIGDVREMAGPGAIVPALCMTGGAGSDPVCSYAVASSSCKPSGSDFVRCALTPADFDELDHRHIEDATWP